MIVYLIGRSPFREQTFHTFLKIAESEAQKGEDVSVIFLQDGVHVAWRGNRDDGVLDQLSHAGVHLYFREEDVQARGITDHLTELGKEISTQEIMAILAESSSIISLL
ncbi:MAG TPA: sulfurtransferase complex subunit TusB [Candidatus Lokiarchaeia archaeon]|nr:sulfurtransferase complex subunit TusB [Candidatus Lokiarchaeia archaeon]